MEKWIRKVKFKPSWMIAGITGGLIASDLRYGTRYGIAFFALTSALWLSYTYGYCKGAREMHDDVFSRIREAILIPLKDIKDGLARARALNREIKEAQT